MREIIVHIHVQDDNKPLPPLPRHAHTHAIYWQSVTFTIKGKEQKLNLKPRVTYVLAAPKVAHSALLASFQGKGTRLAQRLLGN